MSKKLIKCVPPIPLDKIPNPWKQIFKLLNQFPPPPLLILKEPAIQLHLDMKDADWRIALYWIVKKQWNPDLIIPTSIEFAQQQEPGAEVLNQVLKLCTVCFDSKHYFTQHYLHAANWFLNIIQEAKQIDTEIIIENKPNGKNSIIKEKREIIAQFRDLKNPATQERCPHNHRLFEVALSLEKCDEFNKNYWKPFLSACCKEIQAMEQKTSQETFVVNNKIVYRTPGQGKATYTLINLNPKNFV